jgi:cytoskeletal protein CcmA (bactofilin family)
MANHDTRSSRAPAESAPAAARQPGRPLVPGIPSRIVDPSGVVKRQPKDIPDPRKAVAEAEGPRRAAAPAADDNGRLVIGEGVAFTGRITRCHTLVVAGSVEAELPEGHLEVLETGSFRGEATVDAANIAGRFEGRLNAQDALVLAETAQVHGTIRYARIEVAANGRLTGDVDVIGRAPEAATPTASPRQAQPVTEPATQSPSGAAGPAKPAASAPAALVGSG